MLKGKKVLAIVPARGGSKGVKLKNLREVGGVSLVGRVGDIVSGLDFIDSAIVSTDHEDIAHEAKAHGLEVPFYRPDNISGDKVSDLEVLDHALRFMEEKDRTIYDIVLMLQPTSPSRTKDHVLDCTNKLITGNYSSVWTVSETDSKGHPFKQLVLDQETLNYYDSENGPKIIARQQLTPTYHRNGICYAITRDCLLDGKSIRGDKPSYLEIPGMVVNIDTEYDLEFANYIYTRGSL